MESLCDFREIWAVDYEYGSPRGGHPEPICMVALELRSGRILRLWEDELRELDRPPFDLGPETLFVAYFASAEMGCHLALRWQMPCNVLDLYPEFRCIVNGTPPVCGFGLGGALVQFGLDPLDTVEKDTMRELALRGGPWTDEERLQLLDYCESDVRALQRLLPAMEERIDLPRALLRGRYMQAVARVEWNGVPIDRASLDLILGHWDGIRAELVRKIDADYGIYDGLTFKQDRWRDWLGRQGIPWPQTETGRLKLDDETFRQMARAHSSVAPIRELRRSLSEMRLSNLTVGEDNRNRCLLSPFGSKTGRNQPSNTKFIFGPSVWMRSLIQAPPGRGLAYIDWSQQEFGIAAALSGDAAMLDAYESGDPYLAFAVAAGAAPESATKRTHKSVREQFKQCVLGVQYSMGPEALAARIGQPVIRARELLELHGRTFARFWDWSDAAVDHAMLRGWLYTTFGWTITVGDLVKARTLRNFPMQANGAEMLRLAICLATEAGVQVCAPVHDALLIEAPTSQLDSAIAVTTRAMGEASRLVLDGFELEVDVKRFDHPEPFLDGRGARMYSTVLRLARECEERTEGSAA